MDITNDYENDTIICYSDDYVSEGEEVCVYGNGIGVGTYTKTYYDGVPTDYEFEALELNVGFILKENIFTYNSGIPTYIQDFIYGDYVYKPNIGDPYYMEDYLSIDASTINGREYTVKSTKLTFSYTPDFDNLNGLVCFNLVVSTIDRRGNEVDIGLFFDLDGIECNYTLVKHNEGTISSTEFGFYLRAEPVN